MKYITELRNGIENLIVTKNAFMLGEDIQEPYGGAFKVSKGLSEKYPDNIIGTPMCEQGFFGLGVGMALSGCQVIVEVMFGDFITLMCDQMINHAGKFYDMYKENVNFVLRCPSGGYRGYGATHSQSLEKLYFGIPGVQVVAASVACSPAALLASSLDSGKPVLFVENKLDYSRELLADSSDFWEKKLVGEVFPAAVFDVKDSAPDITLITYGGLVPMAIDAMKHFLYEEEINIQVVVPSLLTDTDAICDLVKTKRAVILEEGISDFGWGSEVAYALSQKDIKCKKLGSKNSFIPASKKWEEDVLPMDADLIGLIGNEVKYLG